MSIRWGSWRDPAVARDAKATVAVSVGVLLVAIGPSGLMWVFLAPVLFGGLVAVLMRMRGGAGSSLGEGKTHVPHRGYNISRVAVAGFPGIVLVCGFVLMFWSGAPTMRPVVVTAAVAGCLVGLILILLGRWHHAPESKTLKVSGPASGSELERGDGEAR